MEKAITMVAGTEEKDYGDPEINEIRDGIRGKYSVKEDIRSLLNKYWNRLSDLFENF